MKQRPNVWIQQGTRWDLNIEIKRKFQKYRMYCQKKGRSIFITSGNDSDHMMGSFHFNDDAFDMLRNGTTKRELQMIFGFDYDIVPYSWGFHVEYDPKAAKL
jgi:hypothetical protein